MSQLGSVGIYDLLTHRKSDEGGIPDVRKPMAGLPDVRQSLAGLPDVSQDHPWGHGAPSKINLRDIAGLDVAQEIADLKRESASAIAQYIKKAVGSGLSLLSAAANTIDKPFAATRGIMAGDFKQLAFLLPFSESYLKGFYEKKLGIKIPERHITGREVLESWGAPKNKPGIGDPVDFLFDIAGFAVDILAAPPYMPRVGQISKFGQEWFRIGREGARTVKYYDDVVRAAGDILVNKKPEIPKLNPENYSSVANTIAKAIGMSEDATGHLRELMFRMPGPMFKRWVSELNQRLASKDYESAARMLKSLPEVANVGGAAWGAYTPIQSVTMAGRAKELDTGRRAVVSLSPFWYWKKLGLPELEIAGGPVGIAAAKAMDKVSSLAPVRILRSIFDWTVRDAIGHEAQLANQALIDHWRNTISAANDAFIKSQMFAASLADDFAKLHQMATLGGNNVGAHAFEQVLTHIAENSWRMRTGDYQRDAIEIAKKLFNAEKPTESMVDFTKKGIDYVLNYIKMPEDALNASLKELGVELPKISEIFTEYVAMYSKGTPVSATPIGKPGIAAIPAVDVAKMKSRMVAFRHVPGGHVTIDIAAQDPALSRIAKTPNTPIGDTVMRDSKNVLWSFGDYVRDVETQTIGRVLGSPHKDLVFVAYADGTTKAVHVADLIRTAPPVDDLSRVVEIAFPNRKSQIAHIMAWLKENGIDVNSQEIVEAVKKNKTYLHQLYLFERYAKHYQHAHTDDMVLFFRPFGEKPDIKGLVNALVSRYGLSKSEAARIAMSYKVNGTSKYLVDYTLGRKPYPVYSHDILGDAYRYMTYRADILSLVTGVYEAIIRAARPRSAETIASVTQTFTTTPPKRTGMTLREFYDTLYIPLGKHKKGVRKLPLQPQGLEYLKKMIEATRDDLVKHLEDVSIKLKKWDLSLEDAVEIPADAAERLRKMFDILTPGTREYTELEKTLRGYMGGLAAWLTVPRVAFHVRNYVSNAIMGATAEAPYTPSEFFKALRETTRAFMTGKLHELEYIDEIKRLGVAVKHTRTEDVSLLGKPETWSGRVGTPDLPGVFGLQEVVPDVDTLVDALRELKKPVSSYLTLRATPKSVSHVTDEIIGDWYKPVIRQETKGVNPLIGAGYRMFSAVEGISRSAVYIAARRAGMTPSQALSLTSKVLYDYSRLSTAEKRWLQPSIMFYSWLRQNLGYTIPRIALDWKSGPAQAVRVVGRTQEWAGGDMPDWLKNTGGIPIWKNRDGTTVVVKSFGLPVQDLAMLSPHLGKTTAQIVARTNPVLRTIYMMAAQEDPFTGRPLNIYKSQLEQNLRFSYPDIGPVDDILRLAENSIQGVPFLIYVSRAIAGNAPLFPRVLDALSGINVGTYDLEKMRIADASDRIKEILLGMRGVREFRTPFTTEEASPEAERLAQILRSLESVVRKERKAQERVVTGPQVWQ